MSDVVPCTPCCSTPLVTNVPGPQGNTAVTTTTSSFVIPAIAATVAVNVGDTSWLKPFKNVFVSDGVSVVNFLVTAINSATQFTGKNLGLVGDTAPAATVSSGAIVAPGLGDFTVPLDLQSLPAFTDNSGGVLTNIINIGVARSLIVLGPFSMTSLVNSQLWEVALPFGFTLNSILFRCDVAITTGAKAATFTARINGGATTGGVVAVAGTYATGATQAGTSISGGNAGSVGQTVEALVSGVTAFSEGVGHLELGITNTDLQGFIGQLSFNMNLLRSTLRHQ